MFAEVLIASRTNALDKLFTYHVPETLCLTEGFRVKIPFGAGNKITEGYVISIKENSGISIAPEKIKEIFSVLDSYPIFTKETLSLAKWMSKKYYCRLSDCLRTIAPCGAVFPKSGIRQKKLEKTAKIARINPDVNISIEMLSEKQQRVFEFISSNISVYVKDIKEMLQISDSVIKTLAKKEIILIQEEEVLRSVLDGNEKTSPPELTGLQKKAIFEISQNSEKKPVLICGVTGSGKTEVYMRLIEQQISLGKQAIMLVPEISLTPQTSGMFVNRFGEKVTVTHSRLSAGERFDQWKKARLGKISVMIGPRSAIFAPFQNLGIIIIDEEHEKSYKSEVTPKYDVLSVAEKRAELCGCTVVIGSATPSVSSYYRATEKKEFQLVMMPERVNKTPPEVVIVDMRAEIAAKNLSIFSRILIREIKENLENHQQSILFLNRRGHSSFVSCRSCGYILSCKNCSVNYTYHDYSEKLLCHYCGESVNPPTNCPVCGSKYIRFFGIGTQKLENEIKAMFPCANVLRMDADTTRKKNGHEKIIEEFANKDADILVGTQMLAKGLNFPNVSLVGIIAADMAINSGDFSSAETAYQLITQVSGRAGRGEVRGRVFVQTYMPEHYSIKFAKESDYSEFYKHEISVRRQMLYPPFSHIFMALFSGENEHDVIAHLHKLAEIMRHYNKKKKFLILGPSPCVISKIRNNYRWKILVKGEDEDILKQFMFYCTDKLEKFFKSDGVSVNLTLDPSLIQ